MIALSLYDLALAAMLAMFSACLSLLFSLGFHRSLAWSIVRMVAQLLLVGHLLRIVFLQNSALLTVSIFLVMLMAASWEVGARQPNRLDGSWQLLVNGMAVSLSTSVVSAFALLAVMGRDQWLQAAHALPIAGIILGSAMNAASIALNALLSNITSQKGAIEARLALGATRWQALGPFLRQSVNAGLMPVMNQMVGAGIITMPGIMSGQILAGQDPLDAAKYQIFLMLLLAASGVSSVMIAVYLTGLRLTDERHRLRLDRLAGR